MKIWYSCLLMDPTEFCPFFTTSCLLMDPKTSCLLMDPNQDFPLSKSHVFWWTQFVHIFSKFSPLKPHVFWWTHFSTQTSCLLMDPNLMSFNGPLMIFWVHQKTWGFWGHRKTWVHKKLMSFDGPRLLNLIGSIKRHEVSKVHQRTSGLDILIRPQPNPTLNNIT